MEARVNEPDNLQLATNDTAQDLREATMDEFLTLTAAIEGYTRLFEPGFLKFLDLPRELRDLGYEEYIKSDQFWEYYKRDIGESRRYKRSFYDCPGLTLQYGDRYSSFLLKWAPAIFGTSDQVRGEVAHIFSAKAWWVEFNCASKTRLFAKFIETLKLEKPFDVVRFLLLPHIAE